MTTHESIGFSGRSDTFESAGSSSVPARPDGAPTVGVVIPSYNASGFIDQALASIAAQMRLPDQIIIIDDASTDNTGALALAWADRLPIEVIRFEQNRGSGYGRRVGMGEIRTDLVALLDADDAWLPDHLDHLVSHWQERGGVIGARAWVWRPNLSHTDYHRSLALTLPKTRQLEALLSANFVFSGSLFSRADYERVGGFPDAPGWEDWELWIRMAADGVAISLADVPTVLYRRHDSNQTVDTEHFDRGVLTRLQEMRREHPEWLPPQTWDRIIRYRMAMLRINRGVSRVRRGDPRGAVEAIRGALSGWRSAGQVARRLVHRLKQRRSD